MSRPTSAAAKVKGVTRLLGDFLHTRRGGSGKDRNSSDSQPPPPPPPEEVTASEKEFDPESFQAARDGWVRSRVIRADSMAAGGTLE